ncbi:capsular polysaccharide export protein [Cupriavidus metallidurans]|uniref:capsule biosynthesis protein n=1 Tax=Cupriavidus metallidurans TaxID=119219 RepID=UPI00164F8397|nr:capsular biosynthesis protein [Cupriavidus metallidurans]
MISSLDGKSAIYGREPAVVPQQGGSVASELQRVGGGAPFDRLACYRRVLLLQGPNGPFFARLRDYLTGRGSQVVKVNFNGGDDLFYRSGDIVRFTDPMVIWEATLRRLLAERRIEAIVVFGSGRRQHRIAARVAQSLGMPFWVFEEGYVRPDYITLERGGVNADSPLSAVTMEELPATTLPTRPRRFAHAFRNMALYSFWYFVGGMLGARRYPDYRHHKPFGLHELALWTRAWYRKHAYRWQERGVRQRLLNSDHPHFFMVALQVHNDSQIRMHSPWRRMEEFIEWTIQSFSADAPADSLLVVKHHPMDRGHTDYGKVVAASAVQYGVTDRVVYIHDAHLPSLLHRCLGLVTVNSTSGLQALFHRVPVIALGRCFYAKRGLTFQGSLGAFWNNPGAVDMSVFTRFRNYLVRNSQINSSFYADDALLPALENKRWRLAASAPARIVCMTMLILADAYSGRPWDITTTISFVAELVVG